ncbi:hypothetical protein SAMN04488101_101690 [Pedobacter nyackensis]|uniref:Uncharacterized protein n=1 Tax=Pedobacter nyackensis TaxID=475255 RepID=A0A1W2AK37_9SPHI|nr:hypothetical protein SAMN04488101_101690 [Pedobacter nyackensis]
MDIMGNERHFKVVVPFFFWKSREGELRMMVSYNYRHGFACISNTYISLFS